MRIRVTLLLGLVSTRRPRPRATPADDHGRRAARGQRHMSTSRVRRLHAGWTGETSRRGAYASYTRKRGGVLAAHHPRGLSHGDVRLCQPSMLLRLGAASGKANGRLGVDLDDGMEGSQCGDWRAIGRSTPHLAAVATFYGLHLDRRVGWPLYGAQLLEHFHLLFMWQVLRLTARVCQARGNGRRVSRICLTYRAFALSCL